MAISVKGATSAADLRRTLIPRALPRSEQYRTYFGRALDLDRIEGALRQAEHGIMVQLTDLEDEATGLDPHISGTLGKRFGVIQTLEWDVQPATGDDLDKALAEEIADATRRAFEQIPHFSSRLYDLAWGAYDARAALEIHWRLQSGRVRWVPIALGWIHPRRLSYGPRRELRLINTFAPHGDFVAQGLALEDFPGKFLTWTPRIFRQYPEREGLAPRTLYWGFFKRFSWRMRMILTELFGIPWRIVTVDPDARVNQSALDEAREAAERLGAEIAAGFPAGVGMDLSQPDPRTGDLFGMTNEEVDLQMSKLILGATGTTDATANRAESIVHKSEQDMIAQRDAEGVSGQVNAQMSKPFAELNWGEDGIRHAAVFALRAKPPRDRDKELERAKTTITMGVPVAVAEVRDMSGTRPPSDDEDVIELVPASFDAIGNPIPEHFQVKTPEEQKADEDADAGGTPAAPQSPATAPEPGATPQPGSAPPTPGDAAGPEQGGPEAQADAAEKDLGASTRFRDNGLKK